MGNRGVLHNEHRQIIKSWVSKAWVTCLLEFKGIKRPVFAKNSYSELFFLDEVTAFAAGDRPCAYCRRARYDEFKSAWLQANRPDASVRGTKIGEIDNVLHSARAHSNGGKIVFKAPLDKVPSGTLFEYENAAYLIWNGTIYTWSFNGYTPASLTLGNQQVNVLTPASIVKMYAKGFIPTVHPSLNT